MKAVKICVCLLGCVFLSGCSSGKNQEIQLPDKIKVMLNKKYPGWKFAEVSSDVDTYFKVSQSLFRPHLIWGDFNGDWKKDYAVQITIPSKPAKKRFVIAYIRDVEDFDEYILDYGSVSPDAYLYLFKKGESDYDYEAQERFYYPYDAIGVIHFGKSGVSYIFEDGKFRKVVSSD